jgi:hypothetical protein
VHSQVRYDRIPNYCFTDENKKSCSNFTHVYTTAVILTSIIYGSEKGLGSVYTQYQNKCSDKIFIVSKKTGNANAVTKPGKLVCGLFSLEGLPSDFCSAAVCGVNGTVFFLARTI